MHACCNGKGAANSETHKVSYLCSSIGLPFDMSRLAVHESDGVSLRRWGCFASIQLAEERGFRAWVLREGVRLRTRWRHMPYGDQALFVRRDLFWCVRPP